MKIRSGGILTNSKDIENNIDKNDSYGNNESYRWCQSNNIDSNNCNDGSKNDSVYLKIRWIMRRSKNDVIYD